MEELGRAGVVGYLLQHKIVGHFRTIPNGTTRRTLRERQDKSLSRSPAPLGVGVGQAGAEPRDSESLPSESTIRPSTIDNSRVSAPERVQQALDALGLPGRVRVFDDGSTHTAQEAADAVGCALGQIVKTLFFMAESRPTMVLAAGDRQVDTALLAPILGVGRKKLKMGTPAEVMEYTGYPVGGVAPVGWPKPVDVVVDDSLKRFDEVWAAAGAPNAVFPARTEDLVRAVNGQWAAVVRSPE